MAKVILRTLFITFATGSKGRRLDNKVGDKGSRVNDWEAVWFRKHRCTFSSHSPRKCARSSWQAQLCSPDKSWSFSLNKSASQTKWKVGLLSTSPLHKFRVPLHCQYLSSLNCPEPMATSKYTMSLHAVCCRWIPTMLFSAVRLRAGDLSWSLETSTAVIWDKAELFQQWILPGSLSLLPPTQREIYWNARTLYVSDCQDCWVCSESSRVSSGWS